MTVEMPFAGMNWDHNGLQLPAIRVLTASSGWPDAGSGWRMVRQPLESFQARYDIAGDCLFIETGDLAAIPVDDPAWLALPLVLALPDDAMIVPGLADRADGFVFTGDDADTMAMVFTAVLRGEPSLQVRELSDGTARTINALSAEASRIADALQRLADTERSVTAVPQPVDAALVRRLLKVRRDRERFFPAEIFADPAWDMLLDLAAARLESKSVPVSSLCIAAAVPTTTALRWIRSLTEAGLFERRIDPGDARRTWISLSDAAAEAMLAYLRLFAGQFALR